MRFGLLNSEKKGKKLNQSYYSAQGLKIKEKNTLVIALPPLALLWNFHILLKMYPALFKRKTQKYTQEKSTHTVWVLNGSFVLQSNPLWHHHIILE